MEDKKKKIATATSAIESSSSVTDWINNQPSIVCAYACVPDWPNKIGDFIDTSPLPKKDIDIENVQKLVNEISELSQEAGKIDAVGLLEESLFLCHNKNGQLKAVFCAEAKSELLESIIELVKSHYELEIEKKKDELRECLK